MLDFVTNPLLLFALTIAGTILPLLQPFVARKAARLSGRIREKSINAEVGNYERLARHSSDKNMLLTIRDIALLIPICMFILLGYVWALGIQIMMAVYRTWSVQEDHSLLGQPWILAHVFAILVIIAACTIGLFRVRLIVNRIFDRTSFALSPSRWRERKIAALQALDGSFDPSRLSPEQHQPPVNESVAPLSVSAREIGRGDRLEGGGRGGVDGWRGR